MAHRPRQLESNTSSILNDQSSSSSSSFSMSFSGSDDLVEDMPSTSGCSSDMAHSKKMGDKEKKEKMKRYLRELRTIIKPYRQKGGKIGTLSALEHVLSSLRKQNEKKTKNIGEPVEGCEEGGNIISFPKCVSSDTEQQEIKNELRIILNVKGLTINYVSQNVKEILGHPKDSWFGRLLTEFVHKSDLFTFQSCIHVEAFDSFLEDSDSDSKVPKETPERTVFFRLKCFKRLLTGFSLDKEDIYKPFKVLVRYKYLYPSTIENYMSQSYRSSPSETSREKTELGSPSLIDFDSSSGTYEVKKKYIVLDCMPLTSGYKELGQLPMERTFSTRHTSFCSYSYILPSVTELMGYLPQEMIGSSVFDFYHPDDLKELYKTYKTIIQLNGTPFRGNPIRFRTKNGDWIVTETEWSSFINPWSKKLEFIIGRHTVIKGPENLDVLKEAPHPREPPSEQTLKLHQMIKDLLQQPLDTVDLRRHIRTDKISSLRKDKHVTVLDEPMEMTEEESILTKDGRGNTYKTTKFMTTHQVWRSRPKQIRKEHLRNANDADHSDLPEHVSPKVFDDTSTSMAYDQLNYTSNIKRFLLSQPKSFSPKSDLNKDSNEGYEEEEDQDVVDPDFEVDISVPKPPSFGSSTKHKPSVNNMADDKYAGKLFNFTGYKQLYHNQVLVSEQEHRDDPSASPRHIDENVLEEGLPKDSKQPTTSASNVPTVDCPVKITLTRETLWKHTKLQEELYVAEAKQDRSLFGLRADRSDIFKGHIQRKKRIRSPDDSSFIRNQIVEKIPRLGREEMFGNVLHPPFPLDGNPSGDSTNENMISTNPALIGMTLPVYPFVTVTNLIQPSKNNNVSAPISLSSTSTSASNNNGSGKVEWPYYPVSGGSLNPQVMVGFYQPRFGFVPAYPNISQPQDLLTQSKFQKKKGQTMTVAASGIAPNTYSPELEEMPKLSCQFPAVVSSSEFSSLEDTGSSFMYVLETESAHLSEINTHAFQKLKMEPQYQEPFWLEGIHYTKDTELHYKLPMRKRSRVLKEDREAMGQYMQPDLVVQQLKVLLEDQEQEKPKQPVIDEEADYLIFLEDGEEFEVREEIEADYLLYDSSSGSHLSKFWNSSFCGTMQSETTPSLSQTDTPPPLQLEEDKYEESKDHGYQSSEPYKVHGQGEGVKYDGRCMDRTTSQHVLNKQEIEENMESTELNLMPADENIMLAQQKSVPEVNMDAVQENFVSEEGNFNCVGINMEPSEGPNIDPSEGQKSSEHNSNSSGRHMESMEYTIDASLGKSKSAQNNIDSSEAHMESLEGNVDSSEDMESNCSKESSDLTLSDQRSCEEAASSLKESDISYKEQTYKSKKQVRVDRRLKEVDNLFQKLFVSLPISFPHLKKGLPPWLADVNMTQLIKMKYTLIKRDLKEILVQDKVLLDEIIQPALVSEQFQVLMHELDGQAKGVEDLLENGKSTTDLCWDDTAVTTKELLDSKSADLLSS